ncbi:MAG TPA: porin family protein [Gammaproteobacteria bacterium]|jgi:OOP family OmpA-OmpF porin
MRAVLVIAAIGFWGTSLAQEIMPSGYVGFGVGTFEYEEDGVDFSESSTAYKLYGGYRFNDTWAFEGSYSDLDTLEDSAPGLVIGIDDIAVLAVRGLGHFGPAFVGAGYFDADATAFLELGSFRVEESASENGLTAVVGLQWDFSSVSLRIEYEWFDIDEADATQLGVGLHYRFK